MNELEREVVAAAVEWVNQSRHGRHERQAAKDLRDAVDRLVDENDGRWPPVYEEAETIECDACKALSLTYLSTTSNKPYIETWTCQNCGYQTCFHVFKDDAK